MNRYLVCTILSVLFFASCSDDSSTGTSSTDIPVIEAYLNAGQPLSVKLRTIIPNGGSNNNSVDINALSVTVTSDNSVHQLVPIGDGTYADSALRVAENKEYALQVDYKGRLVTAKTIVPTKPQNFKQSASTITVPTFDFSSGKVPEFPDPVKLTWSNTGGTYYVVIIENMESNPTRVNDSGDLPSRVFRNTPSQNSSYDIQAMQFQYLGKHRLILYHLLPEYAALFNENGGNSLNLKEPTTNVTNGMGIFTATNSDTLFITVKK